MFRIVSLFWNQYFALFRIVSHCFAFLKSIFLPSLSNIGTVCQYLVPDPCEMKEKIRFSHGYPCEIFFISHHFVPFRYHFALFFDKPFRCLTIFDANYYEIMRHIAKQYEILVRNKFLKMRKDAKHAKWNAKWVESADYWTLLQDVSYLHAFKNLKKLRGEWKRAI